MVKPEVRNHNKRKRRLGFDTFIKEDVDIISRHTDYFSKPQSRSNSRGSKRKNLNKTVDIRSRTTSRKSKSPARSNTSLKAARTGGYSNFRTSIYERTQKMAKTRHTSARKKSSPKKTKIPNELKKREVQNSPLKNLKSTAITQASREGRSTMKSTGLVKRSGKAEAKDQIGLLTCSLLGASKGRLTDTSFVRASPTPNKTRGKGKTKKKPKRPASSPRASKKLVVSPSRTVVIYDYDMRGREIVKQETIHEYRERVVTVKRVKKRQSVRQRAVDARWDMTRCKKEQELNRIVRDAWTNISKIKLQGQ